MMSFLDEFKDLDKRAPEVAALLLLFDAFGKICKHDCKNCPLMPCHGAICDACMQDGKPRFQYCPYYKECAKEAR